MSALMCPTKRRPRSGRRMQAEELRSPEVRWLVWPVLVLLAAYLLFCHGCHGDEDTELLAQQSSPQAAACGLD